jgi:hypothetical protein
MRLIEVHVHLDFPHRRNELMPPWIMELFNLLPSLLSNRPNIAAGITEATRIIYGQPANPQHEKIGQRAIAATKSHIGLKTQRYPAGKPSVLAPLTQAQIHARRARWLKSPQGKRATSNANRIVAESETTAARR